jgi:hypothetical protein
LPRQLVPGAARDDLFAMDPMTRLLIRMVQWLRHPPPRSRIILILVVVAIAGSIALVERHVGWPDWATTERVPIRR